MQKSKIFELNTYPSLLIVKLRSTPDDYKSYLYAARPNKFRSVLTLVALRLLYLFRNGLVFFPEFCAVVLKKFREEDEEQFAQIMFKAGAIISKQDCLLQGQAQLDQRVIFGFCTLRLRSKKGGF